MCSPITMPSCSSLASGALRPRVPLSIHMAVAALGRRIDPVARPATPNRSSVNHHVRSSQIDQPRSSPPYRHRGGVVLVLYAWRLPPFTSVGGDDGQRLCARPGDRHQPASSPATSREVAVQDFMHVKAGQIARHGSTTASSSSAATGQGDPRGPKGGAGQFRADSAVRRRPASRSSQAQVDSAEARSTRREPNWKRIEPLLNRGVTTQSQADQARAALEQAQASLAQAKAALEVSRQDLRRP